MSKRRETRQWLDRHRADPYVARSRADDYRARSAYKLAELDRRDRLLARTRCIVDLGAAPGAWSQYCRREAPNARVIALDRLPVSPLDGVDILECDFAEQAGLDALYAALGDHRPDLVLSDMAPNLTGIKVADQAGVMALAELTLALCDEVLAAGGRCVIKVFQGDGFDAILGDMRRRFEKVAPRKPDASRRASAEMYLVGHNWRI